MADIETEGSVGQSCEDFDKIAGCLSDRLSFVHVLYAETVAQARPLLWVIDNVGVHDDGPASAGNLLQKTQSRGFKCGIHGTGSMEGNIFELAQVKMVKLFHQWGELTLTQS